ncbi:uncharacterized protein C20orf202 homolog [Sceloporus undulatus]|uniref:uncharacterized protein C20orf202 homolog n=1 Tax=Sceloporus undulatus TaxID=8520 RepID=UPI001C4B71FA|nr:uncharacterized protein C20orf202 homolog [Sceloporus undulatus]
MPLESEQKVQMEQSLAWLRRELAEMQLQDQQLLEKLLQLHTALRELKVESADWESSDPSRDGFGSRARSSSEDMGTPVPPRRSYKVRRDRRNSLP